MTTTTSRLGSAALRLGMKLGVVATSGSGALVAAGLLAASCTLAPPSQGLVEQVKSARTPKQHLAVTAGYREYSERLRAEAATHAKLAEWWSSLAGGKERSTGTGRYEEAEHCRRLADYLSKAAGEAEALAQAHQKIGRFGEE